MKSLTETSKDRIEILEELNFEQVNNIEVASKKINSLFGQNIFMLEFDEAYKEYIDWKNESSLSSHKVTRLVNNFLSAYKGFIDKWETYLKRNKNDNFIQFYKKSLSEIYEQRFEYRFIYNLRNYAIHSGNPVSSVSKSLEKGTQLKLKKEEFLANHTGMQGKFRKELQGIAEEELDVDNAIKVVQKEILELHAKLFNRQLDSLGDDYLIASYSILKFYNKYNKNNGSLALTDFDTVQKIIKLNSEPGNVNIHLSYLPHEMAKTIIKGASIKFKFKGRNIGKTNRFPIEYKGNSVIEMPKFKTGRKYVKYKGLTWIRIIEATAFKYTDGYDRYYAIYIPEGLSTSEYNALSQKNKSEIDNFFDR